MRFYLGLFFYLGGSRTAVDQRRSAATEGEMAEGVLAALRSVSGWGHVMPKPMEEMFGR